MVKICHIRGNKNYWLSSNKHYTKYPIITKWQKIRNFRYLDYRKKIRDVVVKSIIDSQEYDIICYNDEELKDILRQLKDSDIITIHSQDDDDIYIGGIINDDLKQGIYNTPYVKFDQFSIAKLLEKHNGKKLVINIEDLYKRKNNKYGSCNLIIKSKYKEIKNIINDIASNSFYTRNRIRRFIEQNEILPNNDVSNIINIEIKSFFSLTFLKRIRISLENINEKLLDDKLYEIFMQEFYIINNINIIDIKRWSEIQDIYKQFKNNITN